MNILKRLRKPLYGIYASVFMLLFSCSQYEMKNRIIDSVFDTVIYDTYKRGNIKLFVKDKDINKRSLSLENTDDLIVEINKHYDTDIQIPKDFLQSYVNKDKDAMFDIALGKGWMNQSDVVLTNKLIQNINLKGYDYAIDVFKNQVLNLNLSEEEFSKKNTFVNILEITRDQNPNLFNNYLQKANSNGSCFWATIIFLAALVGAFSCVTIILCGLALAALADATYHFVQECNPPKDAPQEE